MRELISMRKAYGEALVQLGKDNPDIVALSADVCNSDFSFMFQQEFPERFVNVGIAEQALVDVAAGMAYCGKIPFANTFAFLFESRALEMVRTHLCYGGANVKMMAAYSGLSDSFDGPTHHAFTDLAIMRALPNMIVVVPGDANAVKKLLPQVAACDSPVYFRLNRNEVPVVFDENYSPKIGKAIQLREGKDVTIIVCGTLISKVIDAADTLEKEGISVRILEMHTIKPLDKEAIITAARETGTIVTVEEHTVIGGLGSAVSEVVSKECPVPVQFVGIDDRFTECGPYEDLLNKYGMSVYNILAAGRKAIKVKK